MELMVAIFVGVLTGTGIYLTLRARTFDLVLGLTLLSYAVNLLIFVMGRLTVGRPPILSGSQGLTLANYADPLPQALVLTAIVISFAMTALLLVIAVPETSFASVTNALADKLLEQARLALPHAVDDLLVRHLGRWRRPGGPGPVGQRAARCRFGALCGGCSDVGSEGQWEQYKLG